MKQRMKKSAGLVLAFLMLFSMFVLPVSAEETKSEPVSVTVRIEGLDKTLVEETKLEVENFDLTPFGATKEKEAATALHALINALGLKEKDDSFDVNADEGWINSILGYKTEGDFSWMFTVNDEMANVGCAQYALKDGDSLVFYYSDWTVGSYSYFTEKNLTVKAGEPFTVTLNGLGFDADFNPAIAPVAGATLLVSQNGTEEKTESITKEDGTASLSIANPGTYLISAVRNSADNAEKIDISRPYCIVTVKAVFPDIADEQYKEEIEYVAEKGIFSGDENGNFNPDMTITREQAVKIIFSLKNTEPSVLEQYTESNFPDVSMGHWSAKYILWAVENAGVVGDGVNFHPFLEVAPAHLQRMLNNAGFECEITLTEETVTRAEFAHILYGIMTSNK